MICDLDAIELIYGPPPKILSYGDFRAYQRWMAQLILDQDVVFLAAAMGLGKSGVVLWAVRRLLDLGEVKRVLIVAPLQVVKNTWPEEIAKWDFARALSWSVITGDKEEREAAVRVDAELHIINRENLVWLHQFWGRRWPYDALVYDEASRLKAGQKRTKGGTRKDGTEAPERLSEFGSLMRRRYTFKKIIELSGTPAPNGLIDLFGPIFLLDQGERLGTSKTDFLRRWFVTNKYNYKTEPHEWSHDEIMERIADVFFSLKEKDYLTLPPLIENDILVDLPPKAMATYKRMKTEMVLEEYDIEAVNAGVLTNKLLQMANGSIYNEDGEAIKIHDAKLDALESIMSEASGRPVLLAYEFQFDKEAIRKRFPYARFFGEREDDKRDWDAGKIKLLVTHPACLHPDTLVLTEYRGWVKLVSVGSDERVFDGVEFVAHKGCQLSGNRPVVDCFGITMTPDHKVFIGDVWEKAENVRHSGSSREKARYQYAGDDPRLGALLSLRNRVGDCTSECTEKQSGASSTMRSLCSRNVSLHDEHSTLAHLEGTVGANYSRNCARFQTLRRAWDFSLCRMAELPGVLARYARRLRRRFDHRTDRCERKLLQSELPMGNKYGAASEQTKQSNSFLPRKTDASGRILSRGRCDSRGDNTLPESIRHGGCGNESLRDIDLPSGSTEPVYDLVDCGPRHRFVVRNSEGEVFIVHNSAGHGLNLQFGGNIMVWYGLTWSLELYQQFIKRLHRSGQLADRVFLHRILARGTVDEGQAALLAHKGTVQDDITDFVRVHLEEDGSRLSVRG